MEKDFQVMLAVSKVTMKWHLRYETVPHVALISGPLVYSLSVFALY